MQPILSFAQFVRATTSENQTPANGQDKALEGTRPIEPSEISKIADKLLRGPITPENAQMHSKHVQGLTALVNQWDSVREEPPGVHRGLQGENGETIDVSFCNTNETTYMFTKSVLGEGATKVVKIAVDIRTGQFFASTKVPGKAVKNLQKEIMTLENELRIQEKFSGDPQFVNIPYYSTYQSKSGAYKKYAVIMEYCPQTLTKYMKNLPRSHKLSSEQWNEVISIFHDLFYGLQKMQNLGVVHRDIKADNVLLREQNNGATQRILPKITDFGFAADPDSPANSLNFVGSPLFASPEALIAATRSEINKKKQSKERIDRINVELHSLENEFKKLDIASSSIATPQKVENLRAELKKEQELLDSYNPCQGKTDVWSCALMLFKFLFKKNLYDLTQNTKPQSFRDLVTDTSKLSQKDIDKVFERQFSTPNEKKLHGLLKQLLIFDRAQRPDQREAYAIFCQAFDLEPLV